MFHWKSDTIPSVFDKEFQTIDHICLTRRSQYNFVQSLRNTSKQRME